MYEEFKESGIWKSTAAYSPQPNGAVSLLSHKQATVTLSMAEAEYIVLGSAVQEAMWLQQLLPDLRCDLNMPM